MSDLSCDDILASWIESDLVETIRNRSVCRVGLETAVQRAANKNIGPKSEESVTNPIRDQEQRNSLSEAVSGMLFMDADVSIFHICLDEPERALLHEFPAPPPKLHYSTRWRKLARKVYKVSFEMNA